MRWTALLVDPASSEHSFPVVYRLYIRWCPQCGVGLAMLQTCMSGWSIAMSLHTYLFHVGQHLNWAGWKPWARGGWGEHAARAKRRMCRFHYESSAKVCVHFERCKCNLYLWKCIGQMFLIACCVNMHAIPKISHTTLIMLSTIKLWSHTMRTTYWLFIYLAVLLVH